MKLKKIKKKQKIEEKKKRKKSMRIKLRKYQASVRTEDTI